MKKVKIFSIILVVMMSVTSISGCSAKTSTETTKAVAPPYTVKLMMFGDASTDTTKAVSEAISKITKDKINVNVEILRVGFGSYSQQLNLALSSKEKLDAFCTLGTDITKLANDGEILPMDDLLSNQGKDIKKGISADDFKASSVNGKIYGFRTAKETATSYGYIMLKSVVDEIGGVDPKSITTLKQLEDVIVKAKKLHPNMYPIGTDFKNMYMPNTMDNLDGGLGVLGDVFDGSTTVVNSFKTDTYTNFVSTMYNWTKKGLVMPDAANNSEARLSLMKSGKVMGGFMGLNPGNVEGFASSLGKELVTFKLTEPYSITGHVSGILWCIANNGNNPAKVMELLNLAYTNKDVSNLLVNGIEGKQYVVADSAKGIIDYPTGVNASNTTYSRLPWAWPNAAITYNWKGERADQWEYLNTYNSSAHQSVAKGFKFNPDKVVNELTACNNVTTKYDIALQCGLLDPVTTLPKFYAELKSAGIDAVILEKQKQLDDWLTKNKK